MRPTLLALAGFGGSGKTMVTKYLEKAHGYHRPGHINLPMVDMAVGFLRNLGLEDGDILDRLQGSRKDEPIPGFEPLTGRNVLQAIGKDFRDAVDNFMGFQGQLLSIFQELWWKRARASAGGAPILNESLRFQFEARWTRAKGGKIIWIWRPGKEAKDPNYEFYIPGDVEIHNVWDELPPLYRAVDEALEKLSDG